MVGAGGVYTGGGATVVMEPPSLVYVKCFHPGSEADRFTRRQSQEVAALARTLVPKRTGATAASIRAEQNRQENGRYSFGYRVSASTSYAYYVHEGTGPSPRWPSSGRKVMRFHGNYPPTAYRDFVMHPGTPAVPFLQDALVAMVL